MKKNYLLLAAFAALAFTACTNDDEPIVPGNIPEETVAPEGKTIEIAISNTGKGTTKSVRPITSSSADNNVDHVKLDIWCSDNGSNWTQQTFNKPDGFDTAEGDAEKEALFTTANQLWITFVDGTNGATLDGSNNNIINYTADIVESAPGDVDHINKKATLRIWGLKADKMYRITAYGYNGTTDPAYSTPVTNTQYYNRNETAVANGAEEIFADTYVTSTTEVPADLDGDGTIEADEKAVYFAPKPSLELKRQVAGMLAYFENVPAFSYNDATAEWTQIKTIKVQVNKTMSDFYFPNIMLGNATVVGSYGQELYNGIAADNADDELAVVTFDMSKIATNYDKVKAPNNTEEDASSQDVAVLYTFNTMLKGAIYSDAEGKTAATDNKYPIAEDMQSAYTDAQLSLKPNTIFGGRFMIPYDTHYASKTMSIVFYDEEGNELERKDVTCMTQGYDMYHYDILCNNFYSIGQKMSTDSTDGPDKDDETDDDEPASLSGNEVPLRINDAWAVIHQMGIE